MVDFRGLDESHPIDLNLRARHPIASATISVDDRELVTEPAYLVHIDEVTQRSIVRLVDANSFSWKIGLKFFNEHQSLVAL